MARKKLNATFPVPHRKRGFQILLPDYLVGRIFLWIVDCDRFWLRVLTGYRKSVWKAYWSELGLGTILEFQHGLPHHMQRDLHHWKFATYVLLHKPNLMLLNWFRWKKTKTNGGINFLIILFFYLSTSKHGVSKNSARLVTLKPRSNDNHKPLVKQYSDHLESKPRAYQPIATFSCCSHCFRFPYNITLFLLSLFLLLFGFLFGGLRTVHYSLFMQSAERQKPRNIRRTSIEDDLVSP